MRVRGRAADAGGLAPVFAYRPNLVHTRLLLVREVKELRMEVAELAARKAPSEE